MTTPDSLELQLHMPTRLRGDETAPITLHVRNRTTRALDLYLRGRSPTFDVVIVGPTGEVVAHRLEYEIIPAIVSLQTLAPDEELELQAAWEMRNRRGEPLEPGEYTARGLLLTEGKPLETPNVSIRIER